MIHDVLSGLQAGLASDIFAGGLALGALGVLLSVLRQLGRRAGALAARRLWFSLSLDNQSPEHAHLLLWLDGGGHLARARRLRVTAAGRRGRLLAPAPGRHWFRAERRLMRLDRDLSERPKPGREGGLLDTLTLGVLGGDKALVERILAEGARLAAAKAGPELHALRDGWWESLGELAAPPHRAVAAADDRLDRALADLRAFLAARAWYEQRGVPWRRGYLLWGPPGTGKSSAVRALATEAGLDVAVIDLSRPDLTDDALREGLAVAPKGALLLMEDVDAAFAGREEGPGGGGGRLSFSGLLNALDGLGAQEGRPLVMTTNHPERLDPALVRPGRVDLRIELGPATPAQAEAMFLRFFPGEAGLAAAFAARLGAGLSPAAIQGHLLSHRDDPAAAALARGLGPAPALAAE